MKRTTLATIATLIAGCGAGETPLLQIDVPENIANPFVPVEPEAVAGRCIDFPPINDGQGFNGVEVCQTPIFPDADLGDTDDDEPQPVVQPVTAPEPTPAPVSEPTPVTPAPVSTGPQIAGHYEFPIFRCTAHANPDHSWAWGFGNELFLLDENRQTVGEWRQTDRAVSVTNAAGETSHWTLNGGTLSIPWGECRHAAGPSLPPQTAQMITLHGFPGVEFRPERIDWQRSDFADTAWTCGYMEVVTFDDGRVPDVGTRIPWNYTFSNDGTGTLDRFRSTLVTNDITWQFSDGVVSHTDSAGNLSFMELTTHTGWYWRIDGQIRAVNNFYWEGDLACWNQ